MLLEQRRNRKRNKRGKARVWKENNTEVGR